MQIIRSLFLATAIVVFSASTHKALAQGQAFGWGRNDYGETANRVDSVLTVRAISAGFYHSVVARADGSVASWGSNSVSQSTPPAGLGDVKMVAAGNLHTVALKNDGTIVAWGYNFDDWDRYCGQSTVPAGIGDIVSVRSGSFHNLAVTRVGGVVAWGSNFDGQSTVPMAATGVQQVSGGEKHSLALRLGGSVVAWGSNQYGQCSVPGSLGPVTQVAAGGRFSLALRTDGTVSVWGSLSSLGSLPPGLSGVSQITASLNIGAALKSDGTVVVWTGSDPGGVRNVPAGLASVTAISVGYAHCMALKQDGSVVLWGSTERGQTSMPSAKPNLTWLSLGMSHGLGLMADGGVTAWGSDSDGQCRVPGGLNGVTQISAGNSYSLALTAGGTVVAWGRNAEGECNVPPGLNDATMISAGYMHALARRANGTVVAWGSNANGERDVPAGLSGVVQVAAGGHSMAVRADGSVVGWGNSCCNQLGGGGGSISTIAVGSSHNVAIRYDGSVAAWGNPAYGATAVPPGLGSATQVAAGDEFSMALKVDGTVVAWGNGADGRTSVPLGLTGVTQIEAGNRGAFALLSPSLSSCGNAAGAGTATLSTSGAIWQNIGAWTWSNGGGPQVPGKLSTVDFDSYGSVGSACSAQASTLTTRAGTSLLVPTAASAAGNDYSIRVGTTANLAGRLWLLGVTGAGTTLPENLNIPVLSAGTVNGNFDLIQTEVPPPAGKFLTLVPETVSGRTVLSLRLLDIQSSGSLAGSTTGSYSGSAVAAATIDLNQDGFDDLALAVDFGASQPGLIQVLMNDGAGNLGGTSVLESTPPQPTCIAAGDVDGDGRPDLVAGFASDGTARVYRRNPSNALDLLPGTVLSGFTGTPRSVAVVPASSGTLATMNKSRVKPRSMPSGNNVAIGTSAAKLYFYSNAGVQTQAFLNLSGSVEVMARGSNVDGVQGSDIATGGVRSNTVDGLVAAETGYVSVISDQGGGYAIRQTMNITAKPRGIDVADIDDDGLDDIVTANAEPQQPEAGSGLPVLSIFRNRPTGFTGGVPYQPAGASSGLDVTLIDVDGDGDRDIVSVYKRVGTDSEAALLRVDTLGAGTPISIGQTTVLDASDPILCKRGNLDGVGGEDVFLVVQPASGSAASFMPTDPFVKPYLSQQDARRGDLDGSGSVDAGDIAVLLLRFGTADAAADLDGSGTVDAGDIGVLLLLFG